MIPLRVAGANVPLAKEQEQFRTLWAKATKVASPYGDGGETVQWETLWEPTPDELEKLVAGGGVKLTLLSHSHPAVRLDVQEREEEQAP